MNSLTLALYTTMGAVRWRTWAVAYLGYGRHGTCHGRHFDGGAKIAWKKLKALFTVS